MTFGLDTSVVLRLLTGQPQELAAHALARYQEGIANGDSFYVSDIVASETYYAIQHHYGKTREEPASFFSRTAWAKPGRSGVRPDFGGSLHAMCAFVEDENGEVGHSHTISFMFAPNGESRPFRGEAAKLPGVVRAGHYDDGSQGIAYFDTTQGNSGGGWRPEEWVDGGEDTIGGVSSGEWLRYTVDIAKADRYRVKFNYGTPTRYEHTVDLLLDGERLCTLGPMAEHESADWRVDTVAESEVTLPAGRHVLMLHLFGLFNFGKIEFEEIK